MEDPYLDVDDYLPDDLPDNVVSIEDITEDFLEFLWKYRYWSQLGFVLRNDGAKGSGKTTTSLILAFILLGYNLTPPNYPLDPKNEEWGLRRIGIWTDSETLVPVLQKHAPPIYKDKIVRITKLGDIENWMIVVVDEGINTFDAKEALKVENRETGKGATILRHKSVIFLLNSIRSKGILAAFREDSDIKLFKYCGLDYIQNSKDVIVKEYGPFLKQLKKPEALLFSNYPPLRDFFNPKDGDVIGAFVYPLAPDNPLAFLTNPEISLNMRSAELTLEANKQQKLEEIFDLIMSEMVKEFGYAPLIKTKMPNAIREHIQIHYPEHRFLLKKSSYIQRIQDKIIYNYFLEQQKNKNNNNNNNKNDSNIKQQQDVVITALNMNGKQIPPFSDFVYEFYDKNLYEEDTKKKEYIVGALTQWASGLGEGKILNNLGGSPNILNKILRKYKEALKLRNDELRLAYCLEHYIAYVLKGVRGGGISEPDIWFFDDTDGKTVLGCGEVKLINRRNNQITFHKFSKNPNNLSLNPSYLYCKEHGLNSFPLFYFVGGGHIWSKYPICVEVPMDGDLIFPVEKIDAAKFEAAFLTFDKTTFFKR